MSMGDILKKFLEWMSQKERLDSTNHTPPLFKEGEVWWGHTGENVGIEMNGKGGQFTRPLYILKKYDRYSFLGLPLTTKNKTGSWYASVHFLGKDQTIILAQGRVFDYRRLKNKLGELPAQDVEEIRTQYIGLHSTFKHRPSTVSGRGRG
jgi:mRNA interferase MazF